MSDNLKMPCTAFAGTQIFAQGPLVDVALSLRERTTDDGNDAILVFDDLSGGVIDLDLRGTPEEVTARLAGRADRQRVSPETDDAPGTEDHPSRTRGRPKLGVISREVTLLPRQWEWLALQPGGASQMLRRLVDEARRTDSGKLRRKAAQEAAYRFLSAMAGDLPGYEGALRALFAGDSNGFAEMITAWPQDVRNHALKLAAFD